MHCPFCELDSSRVITRNSHAIALRDGYPVAEGHALVVPVRHVACLFDLPEDELSSVWSLVRDVREQLRVELSPDGFNVGLNDGSAAGQTVGHAHVHVIPRREGDVLDPRGGVRWVIPEKADYWTDR